MKKLTLVLVAIGAVVFFWGDLIHTERTRADENKKPVMKKPFTNKALRGYLKRTGESYGVPAIAAAVVRRNGIRDAAAVGVRRQDKEVKVKITDRFHVGSAAKSMTALLAAILVEKGLLNWNTRMIDVFPQLKQTIHPVFRSITFQDLLMHRAAIPAYAYEGDFQRVPVFRGTLEQRRHQFALWQLQQDPQGEPGELLYSNAGYGIAGAIEEQVGGHSWETLLKEHLFKPLGLESAGFGHPADIDSQQPWGHRPTGRNTKKLMPVPPHSKYQISEYSAPGGDVHMSIEDFALYVRLHLQGLHGQDNMLKSKVIKFLHQPRGNYALGWEIDFIKGEKVSLHYGSDGMFFAAMAVCHHKDLAVVVCTNCGTQEAGKACQAVLEKLIGKYRSDSR